MYVQQRQMWQKQLAACRGRKLGSDYLLPGRSAPAALQSQQQVDAARRDIIPGFVASDAQRPLRSYPAPAVPADYVPQHTFPGGQPGTPAACIAALGSPSMVAKTLSWQDLLQRAWPS